MNITSFHNGQEKVDFITVLKNTHFGKGRIDSMSRKILKKHEAVYLPGEVADRIFIIKTGRIKIVNHNDSTKEIIKKVLGAGEFFGEFSMIGQQTRFDFAIAMEETELYVLTTKALKIMMLNHEGLINYMMNTIGARLMSMEQRLESLVFKNSRTRIIDFLNDLVSQKGQRVGYEMVVRKFFTHQEIANITSTSRQTVTTVLNDLRNRNILTFNRRRLLIRNFELLKSEVA